MIHYQNLFTFHDFYLEINSQIFLLLLSNIFDHKSHNILKLDICLSILISLKNPLLFQLFHQVLKLNYQGNHMETRILELFNQLSLIYFLFDHMMESFLYKSSLFGLCFLTRKLLIVLIFLNLIQRSYYFLNSPKFKICQLFSEQSHKIKKLPILHDHNYDIYFYEQ